MNLRDIDRGAVSAVRAPDETEDGTVNVSLRPEHLTLVDEAMRDQWMSETAGRTTTRLEVFDDTNEYAAMDLGHHGAAVKPYRQTVVEVAQSLVEAPTDGTAEVANAVTETPPSQADPAPGEFDADE